MPIDLLQPPEELVVRAHRTREKAAQSIPGTRLPLRVRVEFFLIRWGKLNATLGTGAFQCFSGLCVTDEVRSHKRISRSCLAEPRSQLGPL